MVYVKRLISVSSAIPDEECYFRFFGSSWQLNHHDSWFFETVDPIVLWLVSRPFSLMLVKLQPIWNLRESQLASQFALWENLSMKPNQWNLCQSQSSNSVLAILPYPKNRTCWSHKELPNLLAHHTLFLHSFFSCILKLILAPDSSGRVLHCLWGTVFPQSWIVFLWIKDIKFITKLF